MASERRGTYIGPIEKLKGKTALLLPGDSCVLRAQFDDMDTGYGLGWHTFSKANFELHPKVDFDDTS